MSAALDRKLQQAAAALATGDLARAEQLSREVLDRAPRHPRALQLAAAVRLQKEDGEGAGELLRLALAGDPNNAQLLEGLGVAALKAGNFVDAESWLRRAVGLGKSGAPALTWLGLALSSQGRRAEALEVFRQAVVGAPEDPGVHLNLGHELAKSGERQEAIASYERALRIRPNYAEALNGLGLALLLGGSDEAAAARFREAIAARPDYAEAHANLGDVLLRMDQGAEAETSIRRAIALAPDNADYQADLGHVFSKRQRWDEAIAQYERALAIRADFHEALNSIGGALVESGKPDAALALIRQAINQRPDYAEAHDNLGNALLQLGRNEEANASFQRAITLKPEDAGHYLDFGNALVTQQEWDQAIAQFERALALKADLAEAHYGIGLVRLFRQEFEPGWAEYEWRQEVKDFQGKYFRNRASGLLDFKRLPRWRGPAESGVREVAIWTEQGIGDQLLFSTLIPELVETGVSCVYEVDQRLLAPYQRAFPAVRFVAWQAQPHEALRRAERVFLAGSLPGVFRLRRADFARQLVKLLSALPDRVAHYRQRLDALGPGLKVALSWRSTRKEWWVEKRKAVALAVIAPMLARPGVHLVDVQYGDTAGERAAVEQDTGVRVSRFEGVDYTNDLEEVLAILEACDLLVTTSNATAHLAGALGKRTWLLYLAGHPPFHYWAQGEDHRALWYPAVDIVTGAEHTDWRSLIQAVVARLSEELHRGEPGGTGIVPGHTKESLPSPDGLARVRRMRMEGRLADAIAACRDLLERAPGNADAWCELSHALRWNDELVEARSAATRAIELAPRLAGAWFNLGAIEVAQGDPARGIASYRKALEFDPGFAEAWSNLGDALGATGDKPGEIDAYRRAIAINPRLAPVWSNLGNAQLKAGKLGEALLACRRATELDPDFAAGWNNLGNVLRERGEHHEAVAACEKALRLAPRLAGAWSTLGAALHSLGRYEEAIHAHRSAIEIEPGRAHHHFNLGLTLQHCDRSPEAIDALRRALALDPDHSQARWDLSFALLGSGQLPEGWKEHEWRWHRPTAGAKRYDFAPWDGDASKPRRILLWAEQGVGEHILYGSLLSDLVASPMRITLEVDPRLVSLYQRSFPQVVVIPQREPPAAGPSAYDCQAPLGSLGRWLRPSLESFPRHRGYLEPDPGRVEAYRAQLRGAAATRLAGVAWKSANPEFGSYKSLSLLDWEGILRVPGVRFIDLQYGDTERERAAVERQTGVHIEHLPELDLYDDLEGLAALCAACDLVITASNVTAHVAGALGCPVWLLAPRGNGRLWYWFSGRRDSPWYPSMRIFTQHAVGDWSGMLDEVAGELAALGDRR